MPQPKQTANLLLSFHHDLEALLQVAPSLILVFEADGSILAANDEAGRIIYVQGDKLVGKNIFTIFQFANGSLDAQVLQMTRSQNITTFEGIYRGRMLSCILYPIMDARQKVVRIALLAQDNTDRRLAEDQVRMLTQELERKVLQRNAELQRANQELRQEKRHAELMADFSNVLVEYAHDYTSLIQQISDEIARQLGDACLIVVFSEDASELEFASVSHRSPIALEEMRGIFQQKRYLVERVRLVHFVLQREKYVAEYLSHEQVCELIPPELWPIVAKGGFKGLVGVPLLLRDHVMGAIFAIRHRRESQVYEPEEIAFLQNIAGPLSLAIENARLFDETKQNRLKMRGLSQRLVKIQEEQFQHISQKLHDHIVQYSTTIHINLNLIENVLPDDIAPEIRSRLKDTNRLVIESVAQMRNIISDFLPLVLERDGLVVALRWYVQKFTTLMNLSVTVNAENLKDRLSANTELGLFRITQEALSNIAKHAQATRVEIELKDEGSYILLTVTDNGVGFDPREAFTAQDDHWGLSIMRERASAIGASFHIKSLPGEGTQVILYVPKN